MKIVSQQNINTAIATIALLISIWTLWFTQLRRLTVQIEPEDEIRLRQFPGQTGWSMLFTITASGPETKWATVKFTKTNFTAPDGHVYGLIPMSHLANVGTGQKDESRNVPIGIKGGDSKSVIIGYQSSEMPTWQQGEYHIRFAAVNSRGEYIVIKPTRFLLDGKLFANVQNPQNDQMVSLHPDMGAAH